MRETAENIVVCSRERDQVTSQDPLCPPQEKVHPNFNHIYFPTVRSSCDLCYICTALIQLIPVSVDLVQKEKF